MKDGLSRRTTLALVAIVFSLMGRVARAGDGVEKEPPPDGGTAELSTTCPLGSDCPDKTNGPGVYASDTGSSCLWLDGTGSLRFCPESFENLPAAKEGAQSSVKLKGRLWSGNTATPLTSEEVRVRYKNARKPLMPLLKVESRGRVLAFRLGFLYQPPVGGKPVHAQGAQLSGLTLVIPLRVQSNGYQLELSFTETALPGAVSPENPDTRLKLYRYQASYNNPRQRISGPYCSQPADGWATPTSPKTPLPLSAVAGYQVNGVTGRITESQDSVTLACVSGAIITCMEKWEYLPSNLKLKKPGANPALLLGACIQGKRAAYFAHPGVQPNDFNSYTVEKTEIRVQDPWLHTGPIQLAEVEAVWDEKGAVCFNKENQRRPDLFDLQKWNPTALGSLLPCTSEHTKCTAKQPAGCNRIVTGKAFN